MEEMFPVGIVQDKIASLIARGLDASDWRQYTDDLSKINLHDVINGRDSDVLP
jgi:hypothetical protein